MPERIKNTTKPKLSLKQRRSFSGDLLLDMSFDKNKSNIFSQNETTSFFGSTNTPGTLDMKNEPVNTPFLIDTNLSSAFMNSSNELLSVNKYVNTSTDAILEHEEENDESCLKRNNNKCIFNKENSKSWSPKKESVQNYLLQESESFTSISDDSELRTIKSSECSNNTTPMNVKFKFGDHSRTVSETGAYQMDLENNNKYNLDSFTAFKSNSMEHKLKSPKIIRPSLVNRDSTGLYSPNSNSSVGSNILSSNTNTMHKYSNSFSSNKSKSSKKHRHNLSLPQAHMMTFKHFNNNSSTQSHTNISSREFGEKFFKINVEYQETLSPLIDSVNIEEQNRLSTAKRFVEKKGEHKRNGNDDLEIFYSNGTETFFQRHYKYFKKALQNPLDDTYSSVTIPKWLDTLLLNKEKLYFVRNFQQLSYLERERIDQYFLYQKRLFERSRNNSITSSSNGSIEMTKEDAVPAELNSNSELFSGDVFEHGIKNRYKSVIPYQKTRVILQENAKRNDLSKPNHSVTHKISNMTINCNNSLDSYFNGNYLSTPFKTTENPLGLSPYIATQAPLEHTIRDFYNVLISNKVNLVITLTREIENGMNKCSNFWVNGKNYDGIQCTLLDEFSISDMHMKHCIYAEEDNIAAFTKKKHFTQSKNTQGNDYFSSKIHHDIEESLIIRLLKLEWFDVNTSKQKSWIFVQVQMTTWPDFSVPKCNCDLLNILNIKILLQNICDSKKNQTIQDESQTSNNSNNKVVVHCSSGSGRSGTICCTDALIDIISRENEQIINTEDPVYDIVAAFREQRLHMVQNVNQYMMIYDSLVSFLQSAADGSWQMYKEKFENLDIFQKFENLISL